MTYKIDKTDQFLNDFKHENIAYSLVACNPLI